MNRYMHEEYYNNPELFRRLAHRERARAIGEAMVWLSGRFVAMLGNIKARLRPRARPAQWIARLG